MNIGMFIYDYWSLLGTASHTGNNELDSKIHYSQQNGMHAAAESNDLSIILCMAGFIGHESIHGTSGDNEVE